MQLNWTDGEIEEVSGTIALLHSRTAIVLFFLKIKTDHSLGYPIRIEQINYLSLMIFSRKSRDFSHGMDSPYQAL